jgi:hypothetical protein
MELEGFQSITRWGKVPAWWLHHPSVEADHFCVLAALATYADEHGICEPSQATLARRLGRSRPWVNRVIAELVSMELLVKTARVRRNGGTTSCLYRVQLAPPGTQETPVCKTTGGVTADDSPCQLDDTSQFESKQYHNPRLQASTAENRSTSRPDISGATDCIAPPADWTPSKEIVERAKTLCSEADLAVHTAHFVARCRSKNYRYAPSALNEAWLAWLLEDVRRDSRIAKTQSKDKFLRTAATSPVLRADDRFAAWGAAAAAPRHAWS